MQIKLEESKALSLSNLGNYHLIGIEGMHYDSKADFLTLLYEKIEGLVLQLVVEPILNIVIAEDDAIAIIDGWSGLCISLIRDIQYQWREQERCHQ